MRRQGLRLIAGAGVFLLLTLPAAAQDKVHIFPQFADGRSSDGTYYRSTVTILPWSATAAPSCTLLLYGMTANFDVGAGGYYFTAYVPPGTGLSAPTSGKQALQTGYATLTCSDYVFANVIYSFYGANNIKLGEATVFSSREAVESRMVVDTRDGAHPAIAIANNTDYSKSYTVWVEAGGLTLSARVTIPARRNLARFVNDLVPVPHNSVGVITVQSNDYSYFSMAGFRLTGPVFTAVPVGN